MYYSFPITKLQKHKEKFYINSIFTPESITLHENHVAKIISRKALHSVLLHKSKVTYRDTGVSKNFM